uniref:Uncharacterized protein n=1 Tax=uncultured Thermoplasmata archaeon TaxID=376542 RepID=A0A871Y7R2_9ARCH|nr:hypothetical protein HULAa36F11_00013 [uncultured Thermoplasmata archaeon]
MRESWVRGIFFRQVLEYIKKNRGQTSYELLGRKIDNYIAEEKYEFDEFCELLAKVKLISPNEDEYIAKIARETMTEEATWKNLFRRMDPTTVFASTKRQDGRHLTADYEPTNITHGNVQLKMKMWTEKREHQDLWADFYRGRLEGILELMGRTGTVRMVREFGNSEFTYTIEWA